ncbi:MAG: tyrosine-type recombinase/integrase [Anaerolineales bacterium]|nr:tyrosine-type recombinase/integrase [Anaerolineales bacterium]
MLISDVTVKFLLYLEAKGDRPRTLETYDQRLRLFSEETGVTEIEDVTAEVIDFWVVGMRRRGLAKSTVNNRLRDVKTFFKWCVLRGYLAASPANHLAIKGRWSQTVVKAMDKDDLKLILGTADNARDVALIRFMASTGCRSGEVASVKLRDTDLDKCEAWVTGKTGGRTVDFNRDTRAVLSAWLNEHPNPGSGFVFVSLRAPYDPITPGTIYQLFRRLAKTAGVDGRFNPHSVRHLVGQVWTDETNLELTRQKLGHRDISTTMVYANQDRSRLKAATERIDPLGPL